MKALKMFLWLTFLTGVVYPLFITVIAVTVMEEKATGSLVGKNGSTLIAQKFESTCYFWPRPSSGDYNPLSSGGSNLGPISPTLQKTVRERKMRYHSEQVPTELLYASASGLDPHISPEAAFFQVDRIAKSRKLNNEILKALIVAHTEHSFFGPPCVNVLKINLALDEIE